VLSNANVTLLRLLGRTVVNEGYKDATSFRVDLAERSGMKDPYASWVSGRWLIPEVELAFDISNIEPSEAADEMDNRDDVRVRVLGRTGRVIVDFPCTTEEF